MKVCYVTMVFPVMSEAFACAEIRALRASGVDVSVYTMRSPRPRGSDEPIGLFRSDARRTAARKLLTERGLEELAVDYSTAAAVLRGLWRAVQHPKILLDLAVWILRLNWKNPRDLLKSFILVPRSLDVLFLLQRAEPDVVHIFWGHYPAIVGYLVRRHLPRSVLSMFLGAYDLRSRYPGTSPVARASQVVWTHAQSNVPTIESLGVPRDRIHVVYRGIDVMASPHGATHRVARRVVTAGRLNRAKAMDRVLVAFSRIRQEWPDASLVVLGDGPERPHLVALAKQLGVMPAVTFRGFVSQDDLRHELATAEVFLFLSRIECLPNVVKEAMVSGCVCVVSKTPGIDELVEDTVTGFLVDQDDVEQAARRVAHVFQHPDQVAGLTAAAHRHVAAKFDVTQSMRNYRDAWAELLAARRQMAPDTQQARRRSNPAPRARSMVQG